MSESRKGIRIEFNTQQFPTVKLTRSLMNGLLSVLYEEYEKLKHANASFRVVIAKKRSDISYMFTHPDDFLEEFDSYKNNFIVIKISSGYPNKNIEISLYNHVNKKSNTSVTSDDSDWSRNIRAKIREVLEDHQTNYGVLHSRKSWPIWAAFGIIVSLAILNLLPPKTTLLVILVVFVAASWAYAYWAKTIITWLFPRYEIENSKQVRFRGWILSGLIGGTIVGVISGLILSLRR